MIKKGVSSDRERERAKELCVENRRIVKGILALSDAENRRSGIVHIILAEKNGRYRKCGRGNRKGRKRFRHRVYGYWLIMKNASFLRSSL